MREPGRRLWLYHRVRSKMLKFKKGAYVRQRHARGRAVVATGVPEAGLRGARQQLREEHARGGAERRDLGDLTRAVVYRLYVSRHERESADSQ